MKSYGIYALTHREISRIMRIWQQAFLPVIIMSYLYFEIFGRVIGERIGDINGVDYIAFIAPGLIMMNVIIGSYQNTSFTIYAEKFNRGFVELFSSPMNDHVIIMGFVIGSVFRSIINACAILAIGVCFTTFPHLNIAAFVGVVVSSSVLFAVIGVINGFFARDFDDTAFVPTFFLTPMTFLGGVFFPINNYPGTWGSIARYNPMAIMCSVYRSVILDAPAPYPWWMHAIIWLIGAGIFWAMTWYVLNKTHAVRT